MADKKKKFLAIDLFNGKIKYYICNRKKGEKGFDFFAKVL